MVASGKQVVLIIEEKGLKQISDSDELAAVIANMLREKLDD